MNMEAMTDHAVSVATDAAQEAYSVPDEPFVHTKESWADCIADIVTHPENDEQMRYDLFRALQWAGFATTPDRRSVESAFADATRLNDYALSIGRRVIKNAIKNGINLDNIGKVE